MAAEMDPNVLVAVAMAVAPTLAIIVSTIINYGQAKKAEKAAYMVAAMTTRNVDIYNTKLQDISDTTHLVHTIVNSQHTKLIQLVANLTRRIARDNPNDPQAQLDAIVAERSIGTNLYTVLPEPIIK